jgi:acetoin utilization deacetylase AcuC-like enzyme
MSHWRRAAAARRFVPRAHRPEILFISAGFDAHRDDPLANLRLTEADYAWVTGVLVDLAERHAQGRIVSSLEGGYALPALGRSAVAHVKALAQL